MILVVKFINEVVPNTGGAITEAIAKHQKELEAEFGPCVDADVLHVRRRGRS